MICVLLTDDSLFHLS